MRVPTGDKGPVEPSESSDEHTAIISFTNPLASVAVKQYSLISQGDGEAEVCAAMTDVTYYRQRAQKEREMAAASSDPMVADIHRKLAEEYDELASTGGRRLRVVK